MSQHFLTVIFPKGTIFERLKGRPGGNGKDELEIAMESSGDIELSLDQASTDGLDMTDFSLDGIHLNNIINIFILIFIFFKYIHFSENDARLSTRLETRNAMLAKGNKTAGIKV